MTARPSIDRNFEEESKLETKKVLANWRKNRGQGDVQNGTDPDALVYNHVRFVPQGETDSGAVALSMLTSNTDKFVLPPEIFGMAQKAGFVCDGEVMTTSDMLQLTKRVLNEVYEADIWSGNTLDRQKKIILNELKRGGIFLFPYDADQNNMPCCNDGRGLKWALVCGFAKSGQEISLVCRHGKIREPAFWSLRSLCESNLNLRSYFPVTGKLQGPKVMYDVSKTLAGKFIRLRRKPNGKKR